MEISEVEETVKNYLRAYVLPANVHESNLYGYPNGDTHTKVAERGAEGIAEALKPLLAKVWDEGYDAAAWRSYKRTGLTIGTSADADNPYEEG